MLGIGVETFGFSYSDIFASHLAVYFGRGTASRTSMTISGNTCRADTIHSGIGELFEETLNFDNSESGVKLDST